MNIESLITLTFSETEVKEALIMLLDLKRNDTVASTPEFDKLSKLIEHAKNTTSMIDVTKDGNFNLLLDGVCFNEEVKVL